MNKLNLIFMRTHKQRFDHKNNHLVKSAVNDEFDRS